MKKKKKPQARQVWFPTSWFVAIHIFWSVGWDAVNPHQRKWSFLFVYSTFPVQILFIGGGKTSQWFFLTVSDRGAFGFDAECDIKFKGVLKTSPPSKKRCAYGKGLNMQCFRLNRFLVHFLFFISAAMA